MAPLRALADVAASASRNKLQQTYVSELKDSPSLFDSAPVYHIIPTENTITFAGEYRYYDVTIAPPGTDISTKRNDLTERLDLTGSSASPYVAFSAKHFGFGFAGEIGNRSAHYLRQTGALSGAYAEHLGIANYSGVGAAVLWTPGWGILPKFAVPTVIAGGKSLNVIEKSSGLLLEEFSDVAMTKYQYTAQNFDAGCNVSLNLVKHFKVIPWVNYSAYSYSTPKVSTGASDPGGDVALQAVTDDAELFWKSAPAMTYGIDFAVQIFGFDVHMGGLIGILGTLNKGSDRIQDNSQTLSISFDTKGG